MLLHKVDSYIDIPKVQNCESKNCLVFWDTLYFSLKVLKHTSRHTQNCIGFDRTRYAWAKCLAAPYQFLEIRRSTYKEKGSIHSSMCEKGPVLSQRTLNTLSSFPSDDTQTLCLVYFYNLCLLLKFGHCL